MGIFDDYKKNEKLIKIAMGGDGKVGKTTFLLELAALDDYGPMLIIDTEKGASFYGDLVPDNGTELIDCLDIAELKKIVLRLCKMGAAGNVPFKTIAIDSITTVWHRHILVYENKKDSKNDNRLMSEASVFAGSKTVFDWGQIKGPYNNLMRNLFSLPSNIILTTWQGEVLDDALAGKRPDPNAEKQFFLKMEKNTKYFIDTSIRLVLDEKRNKRSIMVDYDRTGFFKDGMPLSTEPFSAALEASGKIKKPIESKPEKTKAKAKASTSQEDDCDVCSECGNQVPAAVAKASMSQKGRVLCLAHMKS